VKHSRGRARRRVRRSSGLAGAAVRSLAFLLLVTVCIFALRWISEEPHGYASQWTTPSTTHNFEFSSGTPSYGVQARNRRLVYPYSVVPGGVRSADELREIATHDPVVAKHYLGFDYTRARVIEVDHPRLVYVSYRRGGQILWTSKQASLHIGEKLLTDGRITARTRCGNQVSVLPQADTSPLEPMMAELERPDAVASGTEQLFPQSNAVLNLDPLIPIGPPYAGFPQPGGFMPLPIGGGGGVPVSCPPDKKKKTETKNSKDNCKTVPPPPPTVPEPSTMVLMFSGAAAVYARYRLRRA
jgi:hypothetical protein